MEEYVFPVPAVAGRLEQMIEARIHNDGANQAEVRKWQDGYLGTLKTPAYALVDPASGEALLQYESNSRDAGDFAAWLDEALALWKQR